MSTGLLCPMHGTRLMVSRDYVGERIGWDCSVCGTVRERERAKYPGFRWAVTGTHDWKDPAGPFHWEHFSPSGEGRATREHGFTATREEAFEIAEVEAA